MSASKAATRRPIRKITAAAATNRIRATAKVFGGGPGMDGTSYIAFRQFKQDGKSSSEEARRRRGSALYRIPPYNLCLGRAATALNQVSHPGVIGYDGKKLLVSFRRNRRTSSPHWLRHSLVKSRPRMPIHSRLLRTSLTIRARVSTIPFSACNGSVRLTLLHAAGAAFLKVAS